MKCLLVFAVLAAVAFAAVPNWYNSWAVLVAGEAGYENYGTQSSMYKVFQLLRAAGIAEDRIITFFADDIAYNDSNPYPGQVFNEEYHEGGVNENVYANMVKDYTGKDASPENFVKAMTGVPTSAGSGKILRSGENDNVFVFYVGSASQYGDLDFPYGVQLTRDVVSEMVQNMTDNKMYNKLWWISDTDYSASTFYKYLFYQKDALFITATNGYKQDNKFCIRDPFIHAYAARCWTHHFTTYLQDKGLDISIEDLYAELKSYDPKGCQFGDSLVKNMTVYEFLEVNKMNKAKITVPKKAHPPFNVPGLPFCEEGKCNTDNCDCYAICNRRGYPDDRCGLLCCEGANCFM